MEKLVFCVPTLGSEGVARRLLKQIRPRGSGRRPHYPAAARSNDPQGKRRRMMKARKVAAQYAAYN
jgi:hypothetical protein